MSAMNRRGFTLAELIVGLVLTSAVGSAIFLVMTSSSRITRTQYARMDVQAQARAVAFYLASELREVNASEGDIVIAEATRLRYRAPRWTGISCTGVTVSGLNLLVTVRATQTYGVRAPDAAKDSIFVFNENDPNVRTDDVWLTGILIGTAAGTCPDAAAATVLTIRIDVASGTNAAAVAGFVSGGPIRGFEIAQVSLRSASGSYYFAHRTRNLAGTWTVYSDLAGPLTSTGLAFTYYDTTNAATATLADIASVGITIRAQSNEPVQTPAGITNLQDSIVTRVALRNNQRY